MKFDIIAISDEDLKSFNTVQIKLLRTAQQKKNALYHQLQSDLAQFKKLTVSNGTQNSSLYTQTEAELTEEYEYQVEILREQLIYNLALKEPTTPDETGDSGNDSSGYLVDYEMSYLERYYQVYDYYMGIEDPTERFALYSADKVAIEYLSSYYSTLFAILYKYSKEKA